MTEPIIGEIVQMAGTLHPDAFFARIDYWRSGGPGSSLGEFVTSSSTQHLPVDGKDGGPKDKMDRALQVARRQYRDDIEDALRLLTHAAVLQGKWLFPIVVADPDLVDLVTDSPICRKCKGTKEMWTRAKRKTPWRIKAGLGPCCYSAWNAAGRPDLPPVDAKTMAEAEKSA